MKATLQSSGFSLVEVATALGIMVICLIPMIGLVSTGVNAISEADRQSGAARLLEHLESSIRNSVLVDATTKQHHVVGNHIFKSSPMASPDGEPEVTGLYWTPAGGVTTFTPERASLPGELAYACYIEIVPPGYSEVDPAVEAPPFGHLLSPGRAIVRLAWPETAIWSPQTGWSHAQGSVECLIYFGVP